MPPYNHTRGDSQLTPCPICIVQLAFELMKVDCVQRGASSRWYPGDFLTDLEKAGFLEKILKGEANDYQVGGDHYKKHGINGEQHWDRIIRLFPKDAYVYFIAAITKYVERYKDKNGIEDLKKAQHYLQKLIELEESKAQEKK